MSEYEVKYLDTNQTAKILGIHPVTLRRYCQEGKIGFYTIGNSRRFTQADIEQFLAKTYVPKGGNDETERKDDPFNSN